MRPRALRASPDVPPPAPEPRAPAVRSPSRAALVFLRGRDADGRLRELVRARATMRPRLGALAEAVVQHRVYEKLGFRSLGDWSRERIGVGARAVCEWARVWRALRELPRLRAAVLGREVSWTVARKIVAVATPENEQACLATVRGRTVRAVETLLEALRATEEPLGAAEEARDADHVRVRIECWPRLATKWAAAVELARRVSGEALSTWEAAEAIAAEAASALGAPELEDDTSDEKPPARSKRTQGESSECGLRVVRWPWLRWDGFPSPRTPSRSRATSTTPHPSSSTAGSARPLRSSSGSTSRSAASCARSWSAASIASSGSRRSTSTCWRDSTSRRGRLGGSCAWHGRRRRWQVRSARGGSRYFTPRPCCVVPHWTRR